MKTEIELKELRNQIALQNLPLIIQSYAELVKEDRKEAKEEDEQTTLGDYSLDIVNDVIEIANDMIGGMESPIENDKTEEFTGLDELE